MRADNIRTGSCALGLLCLLLYLIFTTPPAVALTLEEGYDAFERGDISGAIDTWQTLAEAGNATAQYNLGQIYRRGMGVPADDEAALKWYMMAAEKGSQEAIYNLITMHEDGRISDEQIAPLTAFIAMDPASQTESTSAPEPEVAAKLTIDEEPEPGSVLAPAPMPQVTPTPDIRSDLIPEESAVASSSPAPISAPTPAPAMAPVPDKPEPVVVVGPQPAIEIYNEQLQRMPPDYFVVQLVEVFSVAALNSFVAQYSPAQLKSMHAVHTMSNGEPAYQILLGPYEELKSAERVQKKQPGADDIDGPWIRKVGPLQTQIVHRRK